MKKLLSYLFALAAVAFAFTSCEDVPMPYDYPTNNGGGSGETTEVEPSGTGTAADPYNVAGVLKAIKDLGEGEYTPVVYVKGKIKSIKSVETVQFGNANYYITDNGSNEVYIFQSYYLGNVKFTAEDQIKVDDEVIVCGRFYNYNGNTPETEGKGKSYIYSLNGKTAEGGGETPSSGEVKGDGTQANPFNAAGANKAASSMTEDEKKENVYVSGIVSKVSIDTNFGNANYYISEDGSTTSEQFYVFRGYYTNGDKFIATDQLKVGQKVTVMGTLVNYKGNTPEMAQGSKIISIDGNGSSTETPSTSKGVTINGTTVTLSNSAATAGTTTATLDLSKLKYDNAQEVSELTLSDGATVTLDANGEDNGPKYYTATKGVRVYKNNKITVNGKSTIAKVVFECDSYKGTDYVGNTTATVTFNGTSAVYINVFTGTTGGGTQLRIKKISVYYAK